MTHSEVAGIIHKLDNMEDKIDKVDDALVALTLQTAHNTMITNAVKYVAGSAFVAFMGVAVFWIRSKLGLNQ